MDSSEAKEYAPQAGAFSLEALQVIGRSTFCGTASTIGAARRILIALCASAIALPALGVTKTKTKVFGEERPDAALVYFVRPGYLAGSGNTQLVFSWKTFQVALENKCYSFAYLEPGTHFLWSEWGGEWRFFQGLFEFEAGKTYYVNTNSQSIALGPMVQLSPSVGRDLISQGVKNYCVLKDEAKAARHDAWSDANFRKRISPILAVYYHAKAAEHERRALVSSLKGENSAVEQTLGLAIEAYSEAQRQFQSSAAIVSRKVFWKEFKNAVAPAVAGIAARQQAQTLAEASVVAQLGSASAGETIVGRGYGLATYSLADTSEHRAEKAFYAQQAEALAKLTDRCRLTLDCLRQRSPEQEVGECWQ